MKLVTFSLNDSIHVGVLTRSTTHVIDLNAAARDINGEEKPEFYSMLDLLDAGSPAMDSAGEIAEKAEPAGAHPCDRGSKLTTDSLPQPSH